MDASQIYILFSIIVLLIIAILMVFMRKNSKNKKKKTFTPLAGLAFGFILVGIIFGDSKIIGYSLIGIGVILAIIDIVRKLKK